MKILAAFIAKKVKSVAAEEREREEQKDGVNGLQKESKVFRRAFFELKKRGRSLRRESEKIGIVKVFGQMFFTKKLLVSFTLWQ